MGEAAVDRPLRVIEISTAVTAAYATMVLGDLGYDVIKVEPLEGDRSRRWPPLLPESGYFESINRNKRSITLDLKSEAGRAVLDRLLSQADVLICNYRPRARARLGLDPGTVHARHPHLVYATVHGSGSTGPRADGRLTWIARSRGCSGTAWFRASLSASASIST